MPFMATRLFSQESLLPGRFPRFRGGPVRLLPCHSDRFPHLKGGQSLPYMSSSGRFPADGAVVVCLSLHIAAGFPTFRAARTCFDLTASGHRLVQISPPFFFFFFFFFGKEAVTKE